MIDFGDKLLELNRQQRLRIGPPTLQLLSGIGIIFFILMC
jgi:hypothetical protein